MTEHPSLALARNVAAMTFADFPAVSTHKAKLHILDTLGVAVAGSASTETQTVLRAFGLTRSSGGAPVWGTSLMLDSRTAGFVNGVSAHAFELDDCGGCDHSGAVVLPALVAALNDVSAPVSGQHFLTAVLAGYEVGRRVLEACGGYEAHNGLGWHSTGTCGTFGAAAAVGKLFGFDTQRHASALGIACSYAGGTWAFIHDGSQTKKLHAGRAAEGGLIAAKLTDASFGGPVSVFDTSAWGSFFTTFGRNADNADLLTAGFGENWRLNRCSIKPYATCRGTHSAIDAIDRILAVHALTPRDIVRIDVAMSGFQAGMCGGSAVASRADAQMSLPYALAARLEYGKVSLAELEHAAWSNPAVARWLSITRVRIDKAMSDEAEPAIKIVTADGRSFEETVEHPLGAPANPMSDAAVTAKFMDLASRVLSEQRCRDIADFTMGLERAADVRLLTTFLHNRRQSPDHIPQEQS